jgi:hypothetical protein
MQNSDDWTTMHSTFIGTGLKAGRVSSLQPYIFARLKPEISATSRGALAMQMHICEPNVVTLHQ